MMAITGCFWQSHPLEGKDAPAIQALSLLNGETMSLAEHRGEHIVILDFWATWCPPCRDAMPALQTIAADYHGKGVRLYAVNVGEMPNQITPFLREYDLDLTVALDSDGRISDSYQVEGIPQTVVIGKEGRIQAVHVGYFPGMEGRLRKELDALLRGESLVSVPESE